MRVSVCVVWLVACVDDCVAWGAGLSEEMYDDGFRNIHNVDISSVVIQAMQEKNARRDEMTWEVMDCTHMEPLKSSSFDVVIDKGTLDAILVSVSVNTYPSLYLCNVCVCVCVYFLLPILRVYISTRLTFSDDAEDDGDVS